MNLPEVTGIVAEYNPLHNGHVFHMKEAARLSGADALIVVLSADFVQRGEPALLSMHERAKSAVMCGADLVIELPAVFSCHNAGVFANSAVNLLYATGIVKNLSFGVEHTDWDLRTAASILANEPDTFKVSLKKNLKNGFSFAEARVRALDFCLPGAGQILQGANNSLALNYVAAALRNNLPFALFPVKRTGAWHDKGVFSDNSASASAIRGLIKDGQFEMTKNFMPEISFSAVRSNLENGTAWVADDKLWHALRALLLRLQPEEISLTGELSEGIENKLRLEALSARSFEEWLERCTSRRYPKGRIRRQAMQLLLGIDRWTNRAAQRLGVPYIRPLAMNAKGQQLLKIMKETAAVPVISSCGDAKFSAYAENIMRYDLLASELRNGFLPSGIPGNAHCEKVYIQE